MGFEDRLTWLILGISIGFFLGYITRILRENTSTLHEIKEELDEVDEIVKEQQRRDHDEAGLMRGTLASNIALVAVILLTAFAAFQSQKAVNGLNDTQDQVIQTQQRLEAVTSCTSKVLAQAIAALNVRTETTRISASSNVDLQRAQSEMLAILLHEPPYPDGQRSAAAQAYFKALTEFVKASGEYKDTSDKNPYPTQEQLLDCIDRGVENANDEG